MYLRSQNGPYWTVARNKEAIAMLEKSVALDPGYAPAWLALGLHYSTEADFGKGSEEMYNKTVAALQRAHELDSDLLAASTMLIERRAFYEDLASSFTQIQELARKRPGTPWIHEIFSEVLRAAGARNGLHVNAKSFASWTRSSTPEVVWCCTYIWEISSRHVRRSTARLGISTR